MSANWAAQALALAPIAGYRLGETSGTACADVTGTYPGSYDPNSGGVWTGGTLGVTGAIRGDNDTGVTFPTAGLYDALGRVSIAGFVTPPALSVIAWVKTTNTADFRYFIGNGNAAGNWAIGVQSNGAIEAIMAGRDRRTSVTINDGAWHFVAVTYANGQDIEIYVDGAHITSFSYQSGTASGDLVAISGMLLGTNNTQRVLQGSLDEVYIYNYVLSAAQVTILYQTAIAGGLLLRRRLARRGA